jgi:hypothetical protein
MKAIAVDQKSLAKELPLGNDILTSEAPVIFQLHLALDQNEQAWIFESVEFHLVQLEYVLSNQLKESIFSLLSLTMSDRSLGIHKSCVCLD